MRIIDYKSMAECGKGWHGILDRLQAAIHETLANAGLHLDAIHIGQIKEKFGGLRFYYNLVECEESTVDEIDKLVRAAEEEAAVTCEKCGAPGETRNREGWYSTKCGGGWSEYVSKRV